MRLYVKNMVCPRCIMSVESVLNELKIPFQYVQLGEVDIDGSLKEEQLAVLATKLSEVGFELLSDPATKLIEKVKTALTQKVQQGVEEHFSIQKFLMSRVFKDYSSVSKLFSSVEGITIEQYFILQRIEKAKELLVYDEMSLSEIALTLGYSSSQHLSSQFKKVTGMTPTQFKELGTSNRRSIDSF